MSGKRNILIVAVILLICLMVLAFTALNIGRTEVNSESFVSTVRLNDAGFDNWSSLGLQLHYASENEEIAKKFLENIAQLLQSKGISNVVILPALIDLQATDEDLEGVFIFHFDFKSSGWQFSRQGKVLTAAEFIPLDNSPLVMLNAGVTISGSSRGWFNRNHFNSELLETAAEYWVDEALKSFKLADHQTDAKSADISHLESNISGIPLTLSGLIPSDGNLLTFFEQGNKYVLSYLTTNEDLESILVRELTGLHNMRVVMPWIDATGGRRLIELISEDGSQEVRIYYSATTDLPYTGFCTPSSK